MSGNHSRRKGHNYERELVHLFRAVMPGANVKRGLQYRDGGDAPDVDCPRFWIEAKRGKKPNPRAALKQAQEATDGRTPVAVIRDDRGEAFVCLSLADFLEMVGLTWGIQRDLDVQTSRSVQRRVAIQGAPNDLE